MPSPDRLCGDLPEMVLQLAGETGQVSLARSGDAAGLRASVDQHACEIRDALTRHGREPTPAALLSYARGFTEAAIGRGWWPPHRREHLDPSPGPHPEAPGPRPGPEASGLPPEAPGLPPGPEAPGLWLSPFSPEEPAPRPEPGGPAPRHVSGESASLPSAEESAPDWESLRLAAVCRMLIQAQGLAA